MTWVQFRNTVKSLMSDASRNDTTAVLAFTEFVKAYLALWVDRNPTLYASYMANWSVQRDRLLGYTTTLSKDVLRSEVGRMLTVDGSRLAVQEAIDDLIATARNDLAGSAAFIDANILQAVWDIQLYIDYYRRGFERIFTPVDAVANGEACTLSLPDGAFIKDVYYVRDDADCRRMPVGQYDWQNRFDLVNGVPRMSGHEFYAAIDPKGQSLILFPTLLDGYHLSLNYDTNRMTFADVERVPFDEAVAQAVADFIQARRYVQKGSQDPKIGAIHLQAFQARRTQLYHMAKERQRLAYNNDSPFAGLCECSICTGIPDVPPPDPGGGTGPGGRCAEVQTVETRAELKTLISLPCRKLLFVLQPEPGVQHAYRNLYGDTRPADDESVIAPDDDLTRYVEYNLS